MPGLTELAPSERDVIDLVPGRGLARHEGLGANGKSVGGHTIARHVGKSSEFVSHRFEHDPDLQYASSFFDRDAAETAVSDTISVNRAAIRIWLAGRRPSVRDFSTNLPYHAGFVLARGSLIGRSEKGVRVVLVRDETFGTGYRIHTAMVTR